MVIRNAAAAVGRDGSFNRSRRRLKQSKADHRPVGFELTAKARVPEMQMNKDNWEENHVAARLLMAVSGLTASEQQPAQSDFYVRTSAGFGRLAVLPAMPVEGAPARRLA